MYFATGSKDNNASIVETRFMYSKENGGYAVCFNVGSIDNGLFGWVIDSNYFRFYRKHQMRVLVPCGRRSAKKEKEARELYDANAALYVREFVAACAADGAPIGEAKDVTAA